MCGLLGKMHRLLRPLMVLETRGSETRINFESHCGPENSAYAPCTKFGIEARLGSLMQQQQPRIQEADARNLRNNRSRSRSRVLHFRRRESLGSARVTYAPVPSLLRERIADRRNRDTHKAHSANPFRESEQRLARLGLATGIVYIRRGGVSPRR